MPKKRRQAHIPQQTGRKRRAVRRPQFSAEPERRERVQQDGEPVFADETPVGAVTAAYGAGGPVETRTHWVGTAQQRQPGRRVAQLRGVSREAPARAAAGPLPSFDRALIMSEMRRILIISAALFGLIIVLSLVLR